MIGQRSTAIVTPLVVGALANTDALDVGDAMAIVLVPAVIVGLAITFVGTSRPRRHARR